MEYGKLVNGKLVYAEKSELRYADNGELLGNHYIHVFSEEELINKGFKKLVYKEKEDENAETKYVEKIDSIEII